MKYNLKDLNRKELEKFRADIDKALTKVSAREMKVARAAAEKAAAAHGFSLADIAGGAAAPRKKAAKAKTTSVPKFRNPKNADQTWTGKGRQPDWYKAAIAAGMTPAKLAI